MTEPIFVASWSEQRVSPDRHVVELEGKTKELTQSLCVHEGGADGERWLTLIPAFQGAWIRVRITVELVPSEDERT